ncbi:hypothetical protein PRUPE_5G162400 [Prunus persica]|uniref:galactinol--sucrose galactosyltransferase n=1 Tax=Prunus persica TaxID=3760 RepID=A0A251P9E1_PRUPE|nr:hypothetical protein PRUPE_5G162400 [Prunus persica]
MIVPSIKDDCLMVRDNVVLSHVPRNISVAPAADEAAFIGAASSNSSFRHVFSFGVLEYNNFMCLFRFKLWWMIPSFGDSGCEVPAETQMLLLETREKSTVQNGLSEPTTENSLYILLLSVLDGPFRASLQGNTVNELEFCIESGDPNVQTSQVTEAIFMNLGDNPFKLIRNSTKYIYTWDAFYHKVDPEGIEKGLKSLSEGGFPTKFLIIDEGWQNKVMEVEAEADETDSSYRAASVDRLTSIEENDKFKGFRSGKSYANLREFVKFIEEEYGLKLVYACHALIGSWGGVLPTSEEMRKYDPWIKHIVQSPGNVSHVICTTLGPMEKYGIGMIAPSNIYRFYDDLHSYLASCNVDGVKVDVQNVLELLGSCYGGREALMRRYQEALEASVIRNFHRNNLIWGMSLSNDHIYRISEDFMQMEPTFQTLHVAAVAFNSLLMGEIAVPDWDTFFSDHYTAEFHAAARALGGCPVYVQLRRNH